MEPRILFSADALSGLVSADPFSDGDTANAGMNISESASFLKEAYAQAASNTDDQLSASVTESLQLDTLQAALDGDNSANAAAYSLDTLEALLDGAETRMESRQEIIFVDAATPDYQQLLSAVNTDAPGTDYQIFILQSDRDGIEQITEILGGFDAVDAIHLVSHGNEAGIQLGNSWLGQASLDDYADAIGNWSSALAEDADLLIYGCNLAAEVSGQQLISNLAGLTGADVAASDDLTGAVMLGGDWDLEHQIGQIETTLAFNSVLQQNWNSVLGTFVVDSNLDTIDSNPGDNLAMDASGNTTLRAAIMEANALGGSHNIVLGAFTYTLDLGSAGEDSALEGDLDILSDITISGADAATTIIDASGIVGGDRVFELGSGNSLTITDVSIQNGNAAGGGNDSRGGGIYTNPGSTLTLERVVVQNNLASIEGGGIFNRGLLKLSDVTIDNNGNAATDGGGGIYNRSSAILNNVTISGNQAINGGGLTNDGGNAVLTNVTFSGNSATTDGGAIYNIEKLGTPGTLSITNSTLTGNTSAGVNGIYQDATSSVDIQNSILNDGGSNISGGIVNSLGNNIDSDGSAVLASPGDQVGNPMLGSLQDNGGFTKTHALLSGSIAINTGTSAGAPLVDQRGQIRIGSVDVGAYEFTDYGLIWGDVGTDSISIATLDGNHVTDLITGLDDPASVAIDPGAGKVYWANDGDGKIQRANLDGSGVEDIVTGLSGPIAIDLYLAGRKIYWTDASGNLMRANLDGSLQEIISSGLVAPTGVAVDGPNGMVYWVDDGSGSIGQTDLTGTPMPDLVTINVNNTADLELDLLNGQIYWTDTVAQELWRADLGGQDMNVGSIIRGPSPYGIALDPDDNKTYWSDSVAGEIRRMTMSNGSGPIPLYDMTDGLASPRDVDFFSLAPLTKSITAPTATNLNSTSAYNEGDPSVSITDIVVTDLDFGEIINATLTLADTSTGSLSANDGATYNGATGLWTIKGTVADVNTALSNLVFNPATDNDLDTSISVSIDDGDEDLSGPLTGTIDLDVTPVNDAPTATNTSQGWLYNEGTPALNLLDIVVTDVDSGETITATLTLADPGTGSLTANDGASYNSGSGVWTITDTLANVNTALANVLFSPNTNNDINTSIGVHIEDAAGAGPADSTIDLDVTPFNDAPTATNLTQVLPYNEGDAFVALNDIVVTEVDTNDTITATLTLTNTSTGTLSANDGASYNGGTGVWTITDTVTNVNTALANVVFNPNPANDVDTTITTHIEDALGTGPVDGSITLDVTPINDAPSATNLSSTSAYNEGDASVAITDIVVSDVDSAEVITATLTLADTSTGSLSANDGASYTAGTGIWTITDTVANVNTALANLVFNPTVNNDVDTSISVNIDDGDEDLSGALTGTITLDVTPINDAPIATNLSSISAYNEGAASVAITDIVVSDVDAGETITATLTLANTATGSLSANDGATYTAGTGVWTLTGTVAQVNTALANLVFNPTVNNDLNAFISVSIDDGDEDGSGALTGTIALNATPVNDAPTATNLSSTSAYNEGDPSVAITDIVVSDVDSAEVITATLTLADTSTGGLSANDGASYTAGTGVWTITGTVAQVNTALANLVFNPMVNNNLDTNISVNIDDGDEDGSGALTGIIDLDVTPVNDAPTATNLSSTSAYTEGAASVAITDIVVADIDPGEIITATLTLANTATGGLSANDGASYTAGTGVWTLTDTVANVNIALANLVFNPTVNNDVDTSIDVNIDDGDEDGSGALTGTIDLDVTPVNDAPTATNLSSGANYDASDSVVALNDIVISDVDSGETVTATLTLANVSAGSLSANNGATYNATTGVWTITGSVAQVNTALANLEFSPVASNTLDTTVAISIDDGDEDSSGPLLGAMSITVNPLPVVDPPVDPPVIESEPDDPVEIPETEPPVETPDAVVVVELTKDNPLLVVGSGPVLPDVSDDPAPSLLADSVVEFIDPDARIDNSEVPRETSVAKPVGVESLLIKLREQLEFFDDPMQLIGAESFITKLNDMREALVSETENTEKVIGSSLTVTAGFSVGYVVWLARSGVLLSSVLSSLPAWRFIDPLPVLSGLQSGKGDDDEESLESMVEDNGSDEESDEALRDDHGDV